MDIQSYDEDAWNKPAAKFKALGHPVRLWIAQQLMENEHSVSEFVEPTGLDFSTVSQHLAVLKNAGVVISSKRGKQIFYSLKCECVRVFLRCVAEHRAAQTCIDQ